VWFSRQEAGPTQQLLHAKINWPAAKMQSALAIEKEDAKRVNLRGARLFAMIRQGKLWIFYQRCANAKWGVWRGDVDM
jgi:hypothetical protein